MTLELTVITGMSGAGKSYAMGAFEDAGWFCVDNLPPGLLPALAELFMLEGSRVTKAAVVCDVRGGVWFRDLERVLERVSAVGVEPRVVFLEASDETLINRFRETRRPHPLADGRGVLAGITRERRELEDVRERADVVIDTSGLTVWDLRRRVTEQLIDHSDRPRLQVQFVSFGYKHGVPREADLLFDVRFLQNPHYVPGLRALTGLDRPVADFVAAAPGMDEFRLRLCALLDFLLPAYRDEGKTGVVIGIGCTGGRHRSVAIAEELAARYAARDFAVTTAHRHLGRPTGPPPDAAA